MATLQGDDIIETTSISVKELRALKKELNDEIDLVKLEPDTITIPNEDKKFRLSELRAERTRINGILSSVNLS